MTYPVKVDRVDVGKNDRAACGRRGHGTLAVRVCRGGCPPRVGLVSFKLPDNYFAIGLALPHDILDWVSRDMTGQDEAGECGKTEQHLRDSHGGL